MKNLFRSESNIFMFIAEHLEQDLGIMAGSGTGCKADQVIRPDIDD